MNNPSPPLFPPEVSAAINAELTDCPQCGTPAAQQVVESERVSERLGSEMPRLAVRRWSCPSCRMIRVGCVPFPESPPSESPGE